MAPAREGALPPGRGRSNNLSNRKGVFSSVAQIHVEDGEPIDRALKRFKKECQKSGIPAEVRRREYYEKPSVKRKRKDEAAAVREIEAGRKQYQSSKIQKPAPNRIGFSAN